MIGFWIAAAVLSALVAALVLYRAHLAIGHPAADPTVDVYRRQLGEIDDLADRGLLADSERRSARAEAARRLLTAADEAQAATDTPAASKSLRLWITIAAATAPLLAVGLYLFLGSPGASDQPFKRRLAEWTAAPDINQLTAQQLAAVLQDKIKSDPGQVQGRILLARVQAAYGDLPSAIQSLKTASRMAPGDADIWSNLGEALVQQAQGNETPAAQDAFRKVLAIDPTAGSARYHIARGKIMAGDVAGGLADWRGLAAKLQPDQAQILNQEIAATEKAGRLVEAVQPAQQAQAQPEAPQGDAADQIAKAAPEQQQAFIHQMVEGLAAKLKANPKDVQGWARLIRAYGVLGEPDKQKAARADMRRAFKGDPASIQAVQDALAAPPTAVPGAP